MDYEDNKNNKFETVKLFQLTSNSVWGSIKGGEILE
jgi:hypothetical protein